MIESSGIDSELNFPSSSAPTEEHAEAFDMSVTVASHPRLCLSDNDYRATYPSETVALQMWWDEYMEHVTSVSRSPPSSHKRTRWPQVRAALLRAHPDKGGTETKAILNALADLRKYRIMSA